MEGSEGNTGSSTLDIWMQLDKFTSQTEEGEKSNSFVPYFSDFYRHKALNN